MEDYQLECDINQVGPELMKAKEFITEEVGGDYLYHSTGSSGLKGILSAGSIKSATGPQIATQAQTRLPTVSTTRDWAYASGSKAQQQMNSIGRDAIIVLDRKAIENNFKTLATSQSSSVVGSAYNPSVKKDGEARSQNTDKLARDIAKRKATYAKTHSPEPHKAGGEYEEAIVVPKGALPLARTMIGFWVNPKSDLVNDPSIMNDPRRLEKIGPNKFIKAGRQQGVAEGTSL